MKVTQHGRVTLYDYEPTVEDIREEVLGGLLETPKTLPSKLFYDERGSQLFEDICRLEEYYPTRTEVGILTRHAAEMTALLGTRCRLLEVGSGFVAATIVATMVAMTFNFFLNNHLTYRDRRLRGVRALFDGWVSFCAVCSVGAVANVGLAAFLYDVRGGAWALPALAGIAVGAVWNFALSSRFTWGRYGRK